MPLPTLDQFRSLLDHFDENDRSDVLAFFQFVTMLEHESLEELGPRLQKSLSPRGLRLAILEAAFYHPWPEWVDFLGKSLRHEADLELFTAGTRALSRIRTPSANHILKDLYNIRQAEAFQSAVSLALSEADPRAAFSYHLGRLLEGSSNTRVANDAAAELARVVSVDDLPQLLVAVQHADLLVARHALRLITLIKHPSAAEFLLTYLQEHHHETLDDRALKEILPVARGPHARTELIARIRSVLAPRLPDTQADLAAEGDEGVPRVLLAVQRLREVATTPYETFLLEAAQALLEGKPARLASTATTMAEDLQKRSRRLLYAVDTAAEGLGNLIKAKVITAERVLPILSEAYHAATGREGVARALAQVVEPRDEATLELIMAGSDGSARAAAIETIGARRDEDMLPFLLMACKDPIVDIAQRAMVALGRLGGAQGLVMKLLLSSNVEENRLGIRIAALNQMAGAVDMLLEYLAKCSREEIALEAVEALGGIGKVEAGDALLDMLHTGQSPRLQVALAKAVRDMGHSDLAFSLATRIASFKNTQLNLVAAEAFVLAHPDRERAMPPGAVATFREQVMLCWSDPNPWPLRARVVEMLDQLYCQIPGFYEEMAALIQAALADKRCQGAWSTDQVSQANNVARDLVRKASERRRR